MTKEDFEEIQKAGEAVEIAMQDFGNLLRQFNRPLYDQWKAGGKAATSEFVSMYPSVPEIVEKLEGTIEEEDEEGNEEEEF